MCLSTACLPVLLPWRARQQHKNITELYPVESTGTEKVGSQMPVIIVPSSPVMRFRRTGHSDFRLALCEPGRDRNRR